MKHYSKKPKATYSKGKKPATKKPVKKAAVKSKSAYSKSKHSKTQELSDSLAKSVSRGTITMAQAQKKQRAKDAKKMGTVKKVATKTRSSSQGLASKRTYKKAKFKRGKDGNLKAY